MHHAAHLFLYAVIIGLATFSCSPQPNYSLAIQDVRLFDSKSKKVLDHKTILINADTIAAVVDASEQIDAKQTIAGDNRLVIPGFIDTHIHITQNYTNNADAPPRYITSDSEKMVRDLLAYCYLDYGVTTVIDMGQPETWMDVTLQWQKNPTPDYPDLFICGGSIVSDEDRRQPMHHIEVMSPEDGRQKVRDYAALGLKYMKLYSKLRKPDMAAMVDEAKQHDITINTHVDNNIVTIPEAMDLGINNFEHFFTLIPSVLSYDEHWKRMNEAYGIRMTSSIDEFAAHMVFFFSYIEDNPAFAAKLDALLQRMAAEGATISTALNVLASAAGKTDVFTSFEHFPIRKAPMTSYTPAQQAQLDTAFAAMMRYMKRAHDYGVKLRIGTDCRLGGAAMLSELLLFYEAGIPMADVLQIATWNGYEAMKLTDTHGSIEVGKQADLVLFTKDPFADHRNLLAEKTVIKDGRLFSIKPSLAYAFQQVLLDEGTAAGLAWLEQAQTDDQYGPLDAAELKNVVNELLGTGRVDEARAVFDLHTQTFPDQPMQLDGPTLTNATYALLRAGEEDKAMEFYDFTKDNFPNAEKTVALEVLLTLLAEGIPAGEARFAAIKDQDQYELHENEMNGVGYLLLQSDRVQEAIAIFKLNVSAFPDSWNVYDSLGEAYAAAGERALAIEHYEKSMELNPENTYGKEMLRKLKKE